MVRVFIVFAVIVFSLTACEQKPTLQKYFVEKSGKKDFTTVDIAPTLIKTDSIGLTEDEQKAIKSLHKFNVLMYKAGADKQEYAAEKDKVKGLLKDDQYEELMKFSSGGMGASISTLGEGENIDEFVVFLHNEQNGFGVIRVLGDDMTPNNVLTIAGLIQKAGINADQLKPLQELMVQQKQ